MFVVCQTQCKIDFEFRRYAKWGEMISQCCVRLRKLWPRPSCAGGLAFPGVGLQRVELKCVNQGTIRSAHKKTLCFRQRVLIKNPARPTFALVGTIIGSGSLTTVFGMGTGVTFQIKSPERVALAVKLMQPGILRLDGVIRLCGNLAERLQSQG
jgi:hypothetical protein